MDWLYSTGQAKDITQSFEILRDVPSQLTKRVKSISDAARDREQNAQDLDLQAFPPLSSHDAKPTRLKRMHAYARTWQALETGITAVQESANAGIFGRIADYAFGEHDRLHKRQKFTARQRIVPTALAISGCINPADHAETFPILLQKLKDKGCYTALLGSRDLLPGGSVAPALQAILGQFSGLSTDADDMQAILAWYRDELGHSESSPDGEAANAILSALEKMALQTPKKPGRPKSKPGNHTQAEEQISSPFGKLVLQTPQTQKLRSRTQPREPAVPAIPEKDHGSKDKEEASTRPLLVLIEAVESADPLLLQDLLMVISENHAQLPITLVLGMATSASMLDQILPTGTTDMLAIRSFQLVQALSKLEAVFSDVLLADKHSLYLSAALMQDLDDQFMHHDFTIQSFQQGLKLACLSHFQTQEFSYLMAESSEASEALIAELPKPDRQRLLELLDLPLRSTAGSAALQKALTEAADWKLALKMLQKIATGVGHHAVADGFSLRELYRDASSPTFAQTSRAQGIIHSLQHQLSQLPEEGAADLAATLSSLCENRQNSELAQQLSLLQAAADTEVRGSEDESQDIQQSEAPADKDPGAEKDCSADQTQPDATGLEERANAVGEKKEHLKSQAKRRQALVKAVQKDAAGRPASHKSSTVEGLIKLLHFIVRELSQPPSTLQGSSIFCISSDKRSRQQLSFAPRASIDSALTLPEGYLGGEPLGLCPEQLDTVIAYQLLIEYGEEVDVADWFAGFCMIFTAESVTKAVEEEEHSPPKKAKRGRPRGSKKVYQDENQDEAVAAKARRKAAKGTTKAKAASKSATSQANSQRAGLVEVGEATGNTGSKDIPGQQFKLPLEDLVARFTQATNELQVLGVVKADGRKKRGRFAQRLVWATGLSH